MFQIHAIFSHANLFMQETGQPTMPLNLNTETYSKRKHK
jgi:hypothetical protein